MYNKTEIIFNEQGVTIKPPQGINLNIPIEEKLKIKALEDYSSDLYSKYTNALEYMQMSEQMTEAQIKYQYWLIEQLKKIVAHRANIDNEIKSIKIDIARDFLEVLSTYSKPKQEIKLPKKSSNKPSSRWRK